MPLTDEQHKAHMRRAIELSRQCGVVEKTGERPAPWGAWLPNPGWLAACRQPAAAVCAPRLQTRPSPSSPARAGGCFGALVVDTTTGEVVSEGLNKVIGESDPTW